ncbi:MAG: hypothetical protein ACHRXM_20115 [Isosphaerales bacterium]
MSEEISEAIRSLLTIEGVEGIGKPVTVISPGDLPPELPGFVERCRAGAIELDETRGLARSLVNPIPAYHNLITSSNTGTRN